MPGSSHLPVTPASRVQSPLLASKGTLTLCAYTEAGIGERLLFLTALEGGKFKVRNSVPGNGCLPSLQSIPSQWASSYKVYYEGPILLDLPNPKQLLTAPLSNTTTLQAEASTWELQRTHEFSSLVHSNLHPLSIALKCSAQHLPSSSILDAFVFTRPPY